MKVLKNVGYKFPPVIDFHSWTIPIIEQGIIDRMTVSINIMTTPEFFIFS